MPGVEKRATGIEGLDAMTGGGLPAGRPCLLVGEPGSGKTLLALNILANGLARGEAGIFVAFEESADEVLANSAAFPWGLAGHAGERLALIDARPPDDVEASGGFDLQGLLAGLRAEAARSGARWVVLDGIDQLLELLPGTESAVGEMRRLMRGLADAGMTVLVTAKRAAEGGQPHYMAALEYLVPTVIQLGARVVEHRLNRKLRIAKYRGSGHATDEVTLVMAGDGLRLPLAGLPGSTWQVFTERVGTGVERLDQLLGGGVHRGSSTLVSGAPGTSKTTLACAFVAAAAARGEKGLLVSFDESADQIERNVRSVGLDLAPLRAAGRLAIEARRSWSGLVEEHFMHLLALIDRERPDCLVIDPISALFKAGGSDQASLSIDYLIDAVKSRGVTTWLTSLADDEPAGGEGTVARVSTIADTWIVLGYQVNRGERNRTLSVVKSRGTRHSNQVRELVLDGHGPDLEDVFALGSEVLMGTARMQREAEEAALNERERRDADARERDLGRRLDQARLRLAELESEARRLEEDLQASQQARAADARVEGEHRHRVLRSRQGTDEGGDEPPQGGRQ